MTAYPPDDYGTVLPVPHQELAWVGPGNPRDWRESFSHDCFDPERVRRGISPLAPSAVAPEYSRFYPLP